MNDSYRGYANAAGTMDMSVDAGLRSFMLGVYNKLGLGLFVSGLLALATAYVPAVQQLFFVVNEAGQLAGVTPLGMIVQFLPLALIFGSMFFMNNPTA